MDSNHRSRVELGCRGRRKRYGSFPSQQCAAAGESGADAERIGDRIQRIVEIEAAADSGGEGSDPDRGEERKDKAKAGSAAHGNAAQAAAATGGRGQQCRAVWRGWASQRTLRY